MNAVPRLSRTYGGTALLSYGFRPFFLAAAIQAAIVMLVWLPYFYGELALKTAFNPRDWHVHELLYGYFPAVITGFVLTAIPNWTGRLPLQGTPLLALVVVWLAGRLAITLLAVLGPVVVAGIDCTFLFLVATAVAREILAGNNWRNLKVLVPLLMLGAGNVLFHVEACTRGAADISIRIGQAAVVILIMIIGGRIIPSFTRNWLARENPGRLPAAFNKLDAGLIGLSVAALLLWIAMPSGMATGSALLAASAMQLLRLCRWAGDRIFADRMVQVLHVAYLFVPLGFLLSGLASFGHIPSSAGAHAWLVGAAGLMTMGVMTRATLGHTGRALTASNGTQAVYAALLLATITRVCAALVPTWSYALLHVAAFAWVGAFGSFCILFGPMIMRPRLPAKVNLT